MNAPGENLRAVRKFLKLTTYQMGELLELPQSTYVKCELGKMQLNVGSLVKLYEKTGALPHFICTGKGAMFESAMKSGAGIKTQITN